MGNKLCSQKPKLRENIYKVDHASNALKSDNKELSVKSNFLSKDLVFSVLKLLFTLNQMIYALPKPL